MKSRFVGRVLQEINVQKEYFKHILFTPVIILQKLIYLSQFEYEKEQI